MPDPPGKIGPGQAGGAAVGVPHSAQNFAAEERLALQFVQCLDVGVPHSAQNFDPAGIWFWQLEHAIIAAAGAASATGAGAAGAAGGC
jgi:hypothetical protein